ncbi:DUF2169 family type VI secretion system accessory protein [Aureimonas leprariae]|uniref:DUF2169 domain-containing protein n=1 Tax=Plantimonas leprariae TaxID=2615207 RepID=A0A7V7PLK4_9HYPH|nr:DUF2169 domain-containing protein [Aureimonas leprariae]KAB0677368.1 DUF2169 domain-containing protein [Aureimonas leprariae]
MSVDNRTPFPAIAFRQFNMVGDLLGVVSVRGTFRLSDGGPLVLADEQYPLVMSDTYEGDPHRTPQMAQTDLVPFKPGTDVTLIGASFAPGGEPLPSWTCGLTVGPVAKDLKVTGPRFWRARLRRRSWAMFRRDEPDELDGWTLSEPEPAAAVPLDWRLAAGGRLPAANEQAPDGVHRFNGVGCGIVDDERFRETPNVEAPQIEAPDRPVASPHGEDVPEGFGPVSPFWEWRTRHAGTYDDAWLAERHPLLPRDFDFRFWQCAHPDLIADPWLRGDEPFHLRNLVKRYPDLVGRLPGIRLKVEVDDATHGPLALDGVHFDLRPSVGRVFLTWRIAFPWSERRGMPKLSTVDFVREAAA